MIRVYLGGSFDPVHLAHVQMLKQMADSLYEHTDRTIIASLLPTAGNPFKGSPTPSHHRLAMLKLAVSDTAFGICDAEIHQPPPCYTIDTVRKLHRQYPDDELIFIIGGDSLASLDKWRAADELLNLVKFWVFSRGDALSPDVSNQPVLASNIAERLTDNLSQFLATHHHNTKTIYTDHHPIAAISSTQIRTAIQLGQSVHHLLHPAVYDYILTHKLYL